MQVGIVTVRAGAYCRVSTDEQAREGLSLPAQRDALLAFCRSQSWDVADIYVDDGYSGKDLQRPAMQRLLADVTARKINLVLVYKLDRLSRRQKDVLYLLEDVFEPAGVAFRSATEPFDTTTPFGKAMLGMLSVFAQLERETIVERTKMGMKQRIKSGDWHGGTRATFGYDYRAGESRALIVNPDQAETVRLMFGLYTDDLMGYEAIARYLNGENPSGRIYATPMRAKRWVATTVARILRNPIYTGRMIHGYHGKRELYPGNHEALIPDEAFARTQEIMADRRDQQKSPKRRSLLSGLLVCAECGGKMRSKSQWVNWPRTPKKVHHNYVCYNYLGEPSHMATKPCSAGYRHGPAIERQVIDRLAEYAFDPAIVDRIAADAIAATNESAEQDRARSERLGKELATTQKRIDRWLEAFESGDLRPEEFRVRVSVLQKQREGIEAELGAIRLAGARQAKNLQRTEGLRQRLVDVGALLPLASPGELWAILHALIGEIHVNSAGEITEIKFL